MMKTYACYMLLFISVVSQGYCLEPQLYTCEPRASVLQHTSTSNVCALNISTHNITSIFSDVVLQNFVAECDNIAAVRLKIEGDGGLGKFEILRSTNDSAGESIYTAWVRRDGACGAVGFLTIPVGRIPVKRGKEYFIQFTGNSQRMRLVAAQEGKYRAGDGYDKKSAIFMVLSQFDSAPYMRRIKPASEACRAYLTPVVKSTEAIAVSEDEGDGYEGDYGLDVCSEFTYLDEVNYVSTNTLEGVVNDLFSGNTSIRAGAEATLMAMPLENRQAVAKKVFEYFADIDPDIENRAKQILELLGPALKPVLPALIEEIVNGPAERIKILSKAVSEKEAMSFLMKLLRGKNKEQAIQAAMALESFGAPETRKGLVHYYYSEMKRIREMFDAKEFVLDSRKKLPSVCVMREFLPERLRKYLTYLPGNGVQFEFAQYDPSPCAERFAPCKELDAHGMANMLRKRTRMPTLWMFKCDVRPEIAQEIQGLLR